MRSLCLFLAVLAASPEAASQPLPPWQSGADEAKQIGENALLAVGGLTVALVGAGLTTNVLGSTDTAPEVAVPLGYAVGVTGLALGVHGTARLLGIDGSLRNALGDAWTGGALGLAAGGATYMLVSATAPEDASSCSANSLICIDANALAAVVAGMGVAVLVPMVWVVSDYRDVRPTVIRRPDGTSAPGLSLTVIL